MATPLPISKPFQTFEQQADKLLSRHLIADRDELVELLQSVNYYRFKGYLYPFRKTIVDQNGRKMKSEDYIEGTSLDTVWKYYLFDRRLRFLVIDAIERIEIALRTQIAYHWAHATGISNPQGSRNNYHSSLKQDDFDTLMKHVQRSFDKSLSDSIQHQKRVGFSKVEDLDVWVFVELTTMGELTRIYRALDYSLQETIAKQFGFTDGNSLIDTNFFYSLMSLLQQARNACAHHSRIWNSKWQQRGYQNMKQGIIHPVVTDTLLPKWNQRWDDKEGRWKYKTGKHSFPKHSTATLLTVCSYFINRVARKSSWKQRFATLMDSPDTPADVAKVMMFSENWRSHPFWKL